jgi:hypothetical protein
VSVAARRHAAHRRPCLGVARSGAGWVVRRPPARWSRRRRPRRTGHVCRTLARTLAPTPRRVSPTSGGRPSR